MGSDIGVTNLPGQQATLLGCVDRELEQHLYNSISDNTPVFTPEPNKDLRRMELFKLPRNGENPWYNILTGFWT